MATIGDLLTFISRLEVLRDPALSHHSHNVSDMAVRFTRSALGSHLDFERLKLAARLHDVGKLLLPQKLLNRTGKLTMKEFEVIKKHTTLGFDLIAPMKMGQSVDDTVLYHHENYDGSGYPFGLVGDAIPIEARIIRIVDMYDALISTRPYRAGYSHQDAAHIMHENQHFFDPVLFTEFWRIQK